jgi:hypothetical protein
MSDGLVWLRGVIEGDRALAQAATSGPWLPNPDGYEVIAEDGITVADGFALSNRQLRATVAHMACHDPRDVIADCDFKLQLLDLHHLYDGSCDHCDTGDPYTTVATDYPCPTLDLLIARYRHRPGYPGDGT